MKVGDLVKALIIEGQPSAIITKVERSERWGAMYHVYPALLANPFPFQEHQLEVISASR